MFSSFQIIGYLLLFLWAVYALYIQGLAEIPVNHVAIIKLFGAPMFKWEPKKAGQRWFLLRGWVMDYLLVKVAKTDASVDVTSKTPDNKGMLIVFKCTYIPDMSTPQSREEYIRNDEKKDIDDRLTAIASERIREWSRSKTEGPRTWEEMQSAHFDTAAILYKTIVDDAVKVGHWIPTSILLKHFHTPKKPLSISELEFLGIGDPSDPSAPKKGHEEVGRIFMEEISQGRLTPAEYEDLKKRVEERRKEVIAVREGSGTKHKHSLGIIITMLNIPEIKPTGKMDEIADRRAEERQQRAAESEEFEHIESWMKRLMKEPPQGLGLTKEQAQEVIFTSIEDSKGDPKVKKTINESKYNVSPETREMLENIVSDIAAHFSGKKKEVIVNG